MSYATGQTADLCYGYGTDEYELVTGRTAMQKKSLDPRSVAIAAVMTAMVFALTSFARIPTTGGGYIHFGDAAIIFVSFAFGPWVGAIAGGLGTAFSDANLDKCLIGWSSQSPAINDGVSCHFGSAQYTETAAYDVLDLTHTWTIISGGEVP